MVVSLSAIQLFALITTLLIVDVTVAEYSPGSVQTGPDLSGSSFPSAVLYDEKTNSVIITGSTFGRYFTKNDDSTVPRKTSNCFLASLSLPNDTTNDMNWNSIQTLGIDEDLVSEACSSIIKFDNDKKIVLLGHSEINGYYNDLYDPSTGVNAAQYGLLLDLDIPTSNASPYYLEGGRVIQRSRVTYPIAFATDNDGWIYVASQETDNVQRSDGSTTPDRTTGDVIPTIEDVSNELDPMRFFTYGTNYFMSIGRYKTYPVANDPNKLQETFTEGWHKPFSTLSSSSEVHVADIAVIGDHVIVVGATDGVGTHIGGDDTIIAPGSMDGFISKFDKETGTTSSYDSTGTAIKSTRRVQSTDGSDDWIAGMCHDPKNTQYVYIVGATMGLLDKATPATDDIDNIEAFIMKVDIDTLDIIWTTQLGAHSTNTDDEATQTRGITCAVDGNYVWFAGVVQYDAVLPDSGTITSYGGDDIFVSKLQINDGAKVFVRQLGSEEDDGLAMRKGITIDSNGNCVVVGNTYGSFYRQRDTGEVEDQAWISDVFVTTIKGDNGAIAFPASHPEFKITHGKDVVLPPQDEDAEIVIATPPNESQISKSGNGGGGSKLGSVPLISIIVALCVVGLIGVFLVGKRSKINRDVTTDRSHVIEYLNEFDVDDIDLKHSATGGWHCSYSNDLANGRNRRSERKSSYGGLIGDNQELSKSPISDDPLLSNHFNDTPVVKDSLFMAEDDNSGSSGLMRFEESRPTHKQGYDGLIDAYNSTWNNNENNKSRRNSRSGEDNTSSVWGKEIL